MPSAPEKRLQRVLHVARFDALSLVVVAAPAALVSLCFGDRLGAAVGAGITLCGAIEWRGRGQLLHRRLSGIAWLCVSQLLCLAFISLYAWHLAHLLQADHILSLLPAFSREQLTELFPDPESLETLLLSVQQLSAAALALAAVVYQGGLAFYYLRSAPAARAVFAEPPVLEPGPLPVG